MLFPLVGCASSAEPSGAEELGEDEAEAQSLDCSRPTSFDLSLTGEASCVDVAGRGGTWRARALFPDAPRSVQEHACNVRWRAWRRGAGPDVDALGAASGIALMTPRCTSIATCRAGACTSPTADVKVIPFEEEPDVIAHTGASGCDVCGVLRNGKIWVINPPWLMPGARKINVALSGGEAITLRVDKPAGAQAYVVPLPPPPAGQSYVEGRVKIR